MCAYFQHRPIALFDNEYGCAPLVKATAASADDKLMRISSHRCFWSTPPAYSGRGWPTIHGQEFRLNDSQSWWEPEQTLESVEPKLGKFRFKKWDDLHFRGSPKHPMT
ncbi:transposase, partial [Microcoleus sp.]|uniref:transposase n=1 Tax=Microcoleus sp. TaxID=44472 RepID=UPI00403E5777